MNSTFCKAGGTLLLVLSLAPGLTAGGKLSRTLATAAGAFALSTTTVPASAADLAAPAPAPASKLWTPYGPVSFKPMSHLCPGPILDPRAGSDLELVEALVKEARQAYADAGCEPLVAEKQMCIGPEVWAPPAGVRTLTADEYIDARLGAKPKYDHDDYVSIRGVHDSTGLGLEGYVCRAMGDFQRDRTLGRYGKFFQRLLEAGYSYRRLQAAQTRASELHAAALRAQPAAEEQMKAAVLKEKAARVKERLASQGNRVSQAKKAQKEVESARAARAEADQALYEVATTKDALVRLDGMVRRFSGYIEPILAAMSPGTLNQPEPVTEEGADSDAE